ncbi:MAG TPA: bifunctional DNA-binding transcriptional regulator/O6-methylguanine-DNA methyltransferase Ada [Burkholderiales bacterium]|nr:bifunctional DNA-binding transcriptional regulator/O6-methylguanine-DNA methyltransferase Ada [Burkholderiales bacterium]
MRANPETEGVSIPANDDDDRWAAVIARDCAADGRFWYAVSTTGIYCRPSCPSRRAKREHVRFYASLAQAEQAGFRPCMRCRPDQPALAQRYVRIVTQACRSIETAGEVPNLAILAQDAGLSRYHFHRIFKAIAGVTPKAYAIAYREKRIREILARSHSVTDAIYDAGFNSNGRFYATYGPMLGMPPDNFRCGGVSAVIRFAVGECSLGAILVAATALGVCAIFLGDDADVLVRDLQDRFPQAELIGGESDFELIVARAVGVVENPALGLDLPLDIQGTVFQLRVWQALREIPSGSTVSYAGIAERIGMPKSARAVARACAANAVAVAIPCHRVVRSDGALSGYRWGVERKRILLDREEKP